MKELLMGNEAVAMGALAFGVQIVTGYPGTPSTEVLETIAKRNPGNVYVEWSVNEKAAVEVAAGAAYCGAYAMVTMKQVGLNVASDPVMCINYIGIKGALVIYVADDPGPISSQTEQDTRHFGEYSNIPVFDPVSPEDAYNLIGEAFKYSHEYHTPVIFRSTTRICHSCAQIEMKKISENTLPEGFIKDKKWVIFPKLSFESKIKLEEREEMLSNDFSSFSYNSIIGNGKIGIACGGISYAYVSEAIKGYENEFTIFKVATPYPFPKKLAEKFLLNTETVIVFEELDSVIEDALIFLCGKRGIHKKIYGKRTHSTINAGELNSIIIKKSLTDTFKISVEIPDTTLHNKPNLPVRPPVLCGGCPHRGAFYAVKKAMQGKKAVFCGDIGCYTLGNAQPLDMVDTCLCMGAGITVAQGINHAKNESVDFAFIGDSTFFASGITGVINAFYNKADIIIVVLDNSTTAMTGHQPHPGIGKTMMGEITQSVSIEKILKAIGLEEVHILDPFDLKNSIEVIRNLSEKKGVRAIIFKSPCIAVTKKNKYANIESKKCIGCGKCIRELGCPALNFKDNKAHIETNLCNGCGLCIQICPEKCIVKEKC